MGTTMPGFNVIFWGFLPPHWLPVRWGIQERRNEVAVYRKRSQKIVLNSRGSWQKKVCIKMQARVHLKKPLGLMDWNWGRMSHIQVNFLFVLQAFLCYVPFHFLKHTKDAGWNSAIWNLLLNNSAILDKLLNFVMTLNPILLSSILEWLELILRLCCLETLGRKTA